MPITEKVSMKQPHCSSQLTEPIPPVRALHENGAEPNIKKSPRRMSMDRTLIGAPADNRKAEIALYRLSWNIWAPLTRLWHREQLLWINCWNWGSHLVRRISRSSGTRIEGAAIPAGTARRSVPWWRWRKRRSMVWIQSKKLGRSKP
jgi:hypothetical protein